MPGPSGSPFSPGPRAGFPRGGYGPGNTIVIDFVNSGEVIGRFHQHRAGLELQADRLVEKVAHSVRDAAEDLAPYDDTNVDEPHVRDNLRVQRRGHQVHTVVSDRGGVRDEVPIYLEIGTYRMAARPFLKPAADLAMAGGGLQRAATEIGGLLPPMRSVGRGR